MTLPWPPGAEARGSWLRYSLRRSVSAAQTPVAAPQPLRPQWQRVSLSSAYAKVTDSAPSNTDPGAAS
eukprot:scaffold13134_cov69-Phaeocystis_antarctica.AAC.10